MKKLVTLLLAALICVNVCILVACTNDDEHEHTFSEKLTWNETHHYFACTSDGCTEQKDKQEHLWDSVTVMEDKMVYTCTVCNYSKNEDIPADYSVDAAEWEEALNLNVNNYVIETVNRVGEQTQTQTVEYNGGKVKTTAETGTEQIVSYMYSEGNVYFSVHNTQGDWKKNEISLLSFNNARTLGINQMFTYDAFTFDGQKYSAASITVEGAPFSYDNVNVYFENGKAVRIEFSVTMQGSSTEALVTFTYGNAGEITVPEIKADTEVTANEWMAAFALDGASFSYDLEVVENGQTVSYTVTVNGNKIEVDFDEEYNVYYDYEDSKYYKYTNLNGKWKKAEVQENEFERFRNYIDSMYGNMLVYDQFEYNLEKCAYEYIGELPEEFAGSGVIVSFLDNVLQSINIKTVHGGESVQVSCDYKDINASSVVVEIPKLDTTVTSEEWANAFAFGFDYKMTKAGNHNGQSYISTLVKYNGKVCLESNSEKIYYEAKGDKYFVYSYDSTRDGYLRTAITYEDYLSATNCFDALSSMYGQLMYNAESEAYAFEQEGDIVTVYMLDDRIVKIEKDCANGENLVFTFDYESVTAFTLPDYIDLNAVTAENWEDAFDVDAQPNYTMIEKIYESADLINEITYIKDGVVLKKATAGGNVEYFTKGELGSYHYYLLDDEWTKTEATGMWEDITERVVTMGQIIAFNEMTYDADNGVYLAATVSAEGYTNVKFKFFEGKLIEMELSSAEDNTSVKISVVYESEQIELPEIQDASAVTESEFAAAVDLPALVFGSDPQDFSITRYTYFDDELTDTFKVTYYNGTDVVTEGINVQSPSSNSYSIWYTVPLEEIENNIRFKRFYKYGTDEEWTEKTYTSANQDYKYALKCWFLPGDVASVPGQNYGYVDVWENDYNLNDIFDYYTYDSVNGCYHAENIDDTYYNVNLYFENGVLIRFTYESPPSRFGTASYVVELDYNPTPLELPTVTDAS